MKPALKAKWIAALLSGEYEQGHEYLLSRNKYCCLGVLCAISGIPIEDGKGLLSQEASERVGLDSGVMRDLAKLNDGYDFEDMETKARPLTFAEIAEHIRGAV